MFPLVSTHGQFVGQVSQVSLRFVRIHILRKFVIYKSLLKPKVSHRQLHKSRRLVTDRSSTTTDKPQATV